MRTSAARRLAAVAAALAVTVLPGLTAPAHAAGEQDCGKEKFRLWSKPDYQGEFAAFNPRAGACATGGKVTWRDGTTSRARSIFDNTRFQLEVYSNENCSGAPAVVYRPGTSAPEIEDNVGSYRISPVCEQGAVCFYENADYTGEVVQNSDWRLGFCTSAGIPARSVYNTTGYPVSLFRESGSCQNARAVDLPAYTPRSYDDTFYGFRVKPR